MMVDEELNKLAEQQLILEGEITEVEFAVKEVCYFDEHLLLFKKKNAIYEFYCILVNRSNSRNENYRK